MSKERRELVDLEAARKVLESWRGQRRVGQRIPGDIWAAAAEAARRHGVDRVSRELRLDRSHLQRRVQKVVEGEREAGPVKGMFVELGGGPTASGGRCVVELEKGNGTKLRVNVEDAATVDWCRLKEAFLGA